MSTSPASWIDVGEMVVPDHVGRLQVFVGNAIIGAHQLCRFLVMEIAPLVGDVLMCLGEQLHRLRTAVAPLLAARNTPLAAAQVRFGHAIVAGIENRLPAGKSSERLQPHVNARLLPSRRQGLYRHVGAGEADIPAISFSSDHDRLGCAFYGPMEANSDTPDLGEAEHTAVHDRAVAVLGIGEAAVAVATLEAVAPRLFAFANAPKEVLDRSAPSASARLAELGNGSHRILGMQL